MPARERNAGGQPVSIAVLPALPGPVFYITEIVEWIKLIDLQLRFFF